MPLSICSDSEEEERPRSAKTSIDLSAMPWPNNIVNLEDVSCLAPLIGSWKSREISSLQSVSCVVARDTQKKKRSKCAPH